MAKRSHSERAAEIAAKRHGLREPLVIDVSEAHEPFSGKRIYCFKVVSAAHANEHAHTVVLDEFQEELELTESLHRVFERTSLAAGKLTPVAPITISPDTNVLTLNPGQTLDETLTVTIPKSAGTAMADVYFLADNTGSMGSIIGAVQAGANTVLSTLNGLGIDMVYGVGNYKDFASGDPYAFKHQLSPTNVVSDVTTAINAWTAAGGGDTPEADLFALNALAVPPGPGIGWRSGSKRIIVWFGDAPGHDPVCSAVSGSPTVTEASATANLVSQGITVLAISTANPGLDDDPKSGEFGYDADCGAPGGSPGQATRISSATGGAIAIGINAGNIVNTIINLVKSAVGSIKNVKLVPSPTVAPFITSITPAAGYGPLAGDTDHTLTFDVVFTGIPCTAKEQVITGSIDVVADGKVVAAKRVQITVPPCAFVYVVKFVCGVQQECGCACAPVQPGSYSTEVNIHNFGIKPVDVVKRFVPLVLAGAPVGREPRTSGVRAEDRITLPAQSATMDDCCRITELIYGGVPSSPMPLTVGFLELTATAEIAVTAVYTATGKSGAGVSIDVEQIPAHR